MHMRFRWRGVRLEGHQNARLRQPVEGVAHHVALAGGDVELEVDSSGIETTDCRYLG